VNEVIEDRSTTWQKIADTIAAVSASQLFVVLHVCWFGGWMLVNAIMGKSAFDPFPFGLLTMVVSLEAIFLSIFVLISQNRSGEKDRIRADLDYQVNLRAHLAVMQLHQKIDRMESALMGAGAKELVATPTSAAEQMLGLGATQASADVRGQAQKTEGANVRQ
jgi:uncharacterized membrane protein